MNEWTNERVKGWLMRVKGWIRRVNEWTRRMKGSKDERMNA